MNKKSKAVALLNFSLFRQKSSGRKVSASFRQYLLYFLIIAVLIIFICIVTIRSYLHKTVSDNLLNANNNIISQIMISHEVLLDEINNSLSTIVFDKEFYDFTDGDTVYQKYNLLRKLDSFIASNSVFSEITMYYPEHNSIISSKNGITDLDSSQKKEFIESVIADKSVRFRPCFRIINKDSKSGVVSMVRSIPLNSDKPVAYVIFDIDTAYMNRQLSSINISNSMFVIMDRFGNYIMRDNIPASLRNTVLKELEAEPPTQKKPVVYEKKHGNEKYYISAVYSDKYQWSYLSLLPSAKMRQQLNLTNNFIIIFSIAIFLTALAAAYILSAKAHAPIRFIASKLKADNTKAPLSAIEENIDRILGENKNLTELLSEYMLHLKQSFLLDLLRGNIDDIKTIEAKLTYYNISFPADNYFMCYSIKTQQVSENGDSEEHSNILTVYLSELLQEKFLSLHPGFILSTDTDEYTVILSFDREKSKSRSATVGNSLSSKIHEIISDSNIGSFSIGVSNLHTGILNIPVAYKESKFALYSNRIVAHNNITLYSNVSNETNTVEYPSTIEQKLTTAIIAGDKAEMQIATEQLRQYITKYCNPRTNNTKTLYIELLTAVSKCLEQMGLTSESLSAKEAELYDTVLYGEITERSFLKMFQKFIDEIPPLEDNIKLNKNQPILENVKNYIRENLDEDLSIDALAEKFYVSPSYLRKLFKDIYSITLKTYIDNERIDRAKELLCDTSVKISDIPEQIGYLSSQSFTRAFKTHTGKTPGEYRSEHVK